MKTLTSLLIEAAVDAEQMPKFSYTKEDHTALVQAVHNTPRDKDFYFIVQCMQKAWENSPNDKVLNGLNIIQGLMSYSVNDFELLQVAVKRVLNGRERSALPTMVRGIIQRLEKFLLLYRDRLKSARTPTPKDIADTTPQQWQPNSVFPDSKPVPPKPVASPKEPFSWSKFAP